MPVVRAQGGGGVPVVSMGQLLVPLVVLVGLLEILPRIFVISSYWVVVKAVSLLRTTLLSVAAEAKE